MGLSTDQEGIIRRYLNEGGGWNSHLNATKNFIQRSVGLYRPQKVGVLGSGWLLDVPVDFLTDNCAKVYLYDIRHPKQVINRYKRNENIQFITMDITGGIIEYVYNAIRNNSVNNSLDSLPAEPGFCPAESLDMLVSVNVLNQLDILIVENLRKHEPENSVRILEFRKKIQSVHIKSLLKGNSCLVTDVEENLYDRTGKLTERRSLLYTSLPKAKYEDEWIWYFDTQMTYYPNRKTFFKVTAKQY